MRPWLLVVVVCVCTLLLAGCAGSPDDAANQSAARSSPIDGRTPPAVVTSPPDGGQTLTVTVIDVVDGDTLDIRYENGTTDTVRLLGVDTPEVHTDVSPAEFEGVPDTADGRSCLRDWGERASTYMQTELAGETVEIQFDQAADRRGTYDRLLTYVILDGRNINYELLTSGYARVFDSSFSLSEQFDTAETHAQTAHVGLWECQSSEGQT